VNNENIETSFIVVFSGDYFKALILWFPVCGSSDSCSVSVNKLSAYHEYGSYLFALTIQGILG